MIRLPATIPELLSEEGQRAILEAEMLLNALQNAKLIVIDANGREWQAPLEFAGDSATIRISLR